MENPGKTLIATLSLGFMFFGIACEAPFGPVRDMPFPPDLAYLPRDQIQTAMWVLAAEIQHLERLLRNENDARAAFQKREVINSLDRMRVAAKTLDQPGRSNQHPVMNENLDRFLIRLDRAKRAAEREPPDFFQASTIAGSCYLCHGQTQGTARAWSPPTPPQG